MAIAVESLVRFCLENEKGVGVLRLLSIIPSHVVTDELTQAQEKTVGDFEKFFEASTFRRSSEDLKNMKMDLNRILSLESMIDIMPASTKSEIFKILDTMPVEWFSTKEVDIFCQKLESEEEISGTGVGIGTGI